ncbi:dihydrofolate reductase family protein [Sinorhizobium meliloti]|uniref:dihydrofolate reductase family protein n=2 Tax=Rhizobium meliloti TaxID=382 RepID=UPI001F3F3C02|nr:dihydrofolate reductase family protein [Sinorhizobium meliloti]
MLSCLACVPAGRSHLHSLIESQIMDPKITCHMIASVDGRLLPERWSHGTIKETSDLIHRAYDQPAERLGGDGWMVGRNTMASYADGERVPAPMSTLVVRDSFKGKRGKRKLAIAIDPFGKLVFAGHELDGDHVVMILSERVEDTYLADLRSKGISYVFAGPDGRNLRKAMKTLHCLFGVREILLQGGGQINGAFLAAGLIDEFSTLVFPAIDGMHAIPSIVDYQGKDTQEPAAGLRLRLIANETLEEGVVWLRHAVERSHDTPEHA